MDETNEIERESMWTKGQELLWYPHAKIYSKHMKTHGLFPNGGPQGVIVHFTAGHQKKDAANAVAYGTKMGHCYLVNDYQGLIHQAFPLNEWGSHAGVSSYPGLGNGVSKYLIGIETMCAGKLIKKADGFYPYWPNAVKVPQGEYRTVAKKDNVQPGTYQIFSRAQEESLITLILWLKDNFPKTFSFDFVLGHDEVAPTRKNDPGGSLSMSMPEFRSKLRKLYESRD